MTYNDGLEAAAKLIEGGAKLHWDAVGETDIHEDLSMSERDGHIYSGEELDGFAAQIRALKVPYPFCRRPEHCAGRSSCDGDPACNE